MKSPPFLRTTLVLFFLNYKTSFTVKITVASLYSYYIIRSDLIYFKFVVLFASLYYISLHILTLLIFVSSVYHMSSHYSCCIIMFERFPIRVWITLTVCLRNITHHDIIPKILHTQDLYLILFEVRGVNVYCSSFKPSFRSI